MLQKLKDSLQVLGMGARYMGHTLYRATRATMLALARAFAYVLLHWAKIAFLAIGIVIGHFGPGVYDQYAPWALDPVATKDHVWVGMPVVSKDGVDVGKIHSVVLAAGWGDRKTSPPRSIYVKEWRLYSYPLTRNLQPAMYKHNAKAKRIELIQTAARHREQPTESWRPHWWLKNYWPGNWTW
jgi:hypothetical protein